MIKPPNWHGKYAATDDKTRRARFHPLPRGRGGSESLREFHVNDTVSDDLSDVLVKSVMDCRY